MVAKRGRPSKSGDRYKCGKLKPADTSKQPISPALWQRIKTNGQKIGLDPRLGTELGRLALHDELTSMEVSAGLRIAEIYQGFEFFHGRTRSAAGSSFFRQFVADLEKPIEVTRRRTDDYISIDQEEREREAREDFDVLQYYMPPAQRDIVEQVCVTSRPINPVSFPVLKMVLQYFFEIFRDDKNYRSKRSKKFDADAPNGLVEPIGLMSAPWQAQPEGLQDRDRSRQRRARGPCSCISAGNPCPRCRLRQQSRPIDRHGRHN